MSHSLAFALLLTLAPATIAWWTGRPLARRMDDPALPELLLAHGQRLGTVTLAGIILLGIFFSDQWFWSLPLLFIALLAGRYPLRRSLFGEQWGIGAYLRYGVFSVIGGVGLWFFAAFMPAIVLAIVSPLVARDDMHRAATLAGVLGGVFGILLLLWQWHYAALWLRLHRATRLSESAPASLVARLDAIIDRAGASLHRRPTVHRYGATGGYVMNAVAIPSLRAPAVAFGDTLLATLTEDEIVAVFAHEVAHHEQFTVRRLRRSWWAAVSIVVLSAALPPVMILTAPVAASVVAWLVPLAIVIALGKRAKASRADETASDRRAVALTGDPAAMASALRKLHLYSRVPRRWPHDFERMASHPSLARRIQAIEEAGAVAATPLAAPSAFRSAKPGHAVVFDDVRAHWFEGLPDDTPLELTSLRDRASSYRAVAYRDLTELRVATLGDERVLKATDRTGRSWILGLRSEDVGAVQLALDVVDVQLGQPSASVDGSPGTSRALALLLLLSLAWAGELGLMLIPLAILLFRPTRAAIVATAAMALAHTLIALTGSSVSSGLQPLAASVAGASAGTLLFLLFRARRRDKEPAPLDGILAWRESRLTIGALAIVVVILMAGLTPVLAKRPGTALDHPFSLSLATALLGLGVALGTLRQKKWRFGGLGTAAIGAATVVGISGDGWIYDRVPPFSWTDASARLVSTVPLDGHAYQLELSPGAKYFVARKTLPARRGLDTRFRFVVGGLATAGDTARQSFDALAFVFVDDDRALVLSSAGDDSLTLRLVGLRRPAASDGIRADTVWARRLVWAPDAQLFVDRGTGDWTVVGHDVDGQYLAIVNGRVGRDNVAFHMVERTEEVSRAVAGFSNGTALTLSFQGTSAESTPGIWLAGLASLSMRWEVSRIGSASRDRVGSIDGYLNCGVVVVSDIALCAEFGRRWSLLWNAPASGQLAQVGRIPAGYDLTHVEDGRRMTAASRSQPRLALLDVRSRRGVRVHLPADAGQTANKAPRWFDAAAWSGSRVGVLSTSMGGSRVLIYRLD